MPSVLVHGDLVDTNDAGRYDTPQTVRARFATPAAMVDEALRCLDRPRAEKEMVRSGRPSRGTSGGSLDRASGFAGGHWVSGPLDSGVFDCRWHRLTAEVEIPSGTSLRVSALTTTDLVSPGQPAVSRDVVGVGCAPRGGDAPRRLDAMLRTWPGQVPFGSNRARGGRLLPRRQSTGSS